MKYLALLLLLIPLSLFGQVESQFNGTLNVFSASRIGSTNTFIISGIFSSTTSSYTSANSAIGDIVQVQSGSRFYWLHIYSIAGNSGGVITGNVRDSSSTLTVFPTGKWSIFRPTPNLRLPLSPDGETNASRSATFNTLALRVDELESNSGIADGDKGDVRVTNLGDTWTIDTGAVNSIKIAPQTVDSLDLKNRSITTIKLKDNSITTAKIASAQINKSKLTQSLQDSLLRFRKDTSIIVGSGTTNLGSLSNTFGKYNRVRITCLLPNAGTASVILPSLTDTLKNTEFKVTLYAQDSTGGVMNVTGFDGFAFWFDGTSINDIEPIVYIFNRQTITLKGIYQNSSWSWLSEVSKDWIGTVLEEESSGITSLTGDVTASGSGSVTATIPTGTITSAKILDGTIASVDIASQTIDSVDVKNRSVTTVKLEDGAVTSLKVLDNSLTGSDLTYLTLRAGTSSNASLQLTSGTDKTTLTGGEILYNGRFAVGIGSSKRRIATVNDASASNGQIPIGNGTDFTTANITTGFGADVTNGAGTIAITPDTTELIPFIPSAEISNGTRDGYFRTQTSFGHQFYNGGFRIFNSSLATTIGATGLGVSDAANTYRSTIQASITSGNVPTLTIAAVGSERGDKSYTFEEKGATISVLYSSIGANSQAVATYQIDGENSIEYITNSTPTNVTLPEIVGTSLVANKVGVGFTMWICVNSSVGKNINVAGSDVIIRHGSTSTVTAITTTGGTYYLKKFVALDLNTWGEF